LGVGGMNVPHNGSSLRGFGPIAWQASFVSWPAAEERRRRTAFGLLRRFSDAVSRRRALTRSPPALERRLSVVAGGLAHCVQGGWTKVGSARPESELFWVFGIIAKAPGASVTCYDGSGDSADWQWPPLTSPPVRFF
jgi:hypothetical protein